MTDAATAQAGTNTAATAERRADHVAMLCMGTEVYGIGTIEKLYAQGMPGMSFICMTRGAMSEWLESGGYRVDVVEGLDTFTATGSSIATLLRMPGKFKEAKRDARRIHDVIRDRGIRIVHGHWLPQQMIGGAMRRLGYKSVWQINQNMNRSRLMGFGARLQHRLARWGADLLLPASDYVGRNWNGSGVPQRTIRNAAIPLYDAPNELPPSPVRGVVAGRMAHSKGHHLAVAAVLAARKAGFEVELDIFGGPTEDNPYLDGLRQTIRDANAEDAIRVMGFCDDLRQRHQSYHIGFQCRIDHEPCALWVCESHVDGLPLLASATGGTPELVDEGVTGLLYESDNAEALTECLVEVLKDPDRLAAMRPMAFERGRQHFTLDRFVEQTFDAYDTLD